jgi:DNA-binding IclR family transcriptional regulator
MPTVQSIERAFQVLEAVGPGGAGLSDLAAQVSLPKSTVARLLKTLENVGAVERLEGPRYRIGQGLVALAGTARGLADLAARARPRLRELADAGGEDAGLSVPEGHRVHYIAQEDAGNDVQVRDWTGSILPLHANSSGLAMLAQWPDEALDRYLEGDLERFTERTVTSPDLVRERLEAARADGHVWVFEEYVEGINSVAAPVFDQRGRCIAAVHVHGPSYRFPHGGERDEPARLVMVAASSVAEAVRR